METKKFTYEMRTNEGMARDVLEILKENEFCLIENFPIKESLQTVREQFQFFCEQFGMLLAQDKEGTIIANVERVLTENEFNRGHKSNLMLPFHNDRSDIIALLCVGEPESGGVTKVIQSKAVYNYILQNNPDILKQLEQLFPFDKRDDQFGIERYYELPIFSNNEGQIITRYIRKFISSSQENPNSPRLTERQLLALNYLDEVLEMEEIHYSFELKKGQILILNNFTTLHSRTAFEDSQKNKRVLLRSWISCPEINNLTDIFSVFVGDINAPNRGGMRCLEDLKMNQTKQTDDTRK